MIVVLDANTWVSALARPMGPSGRVLDAFLEGRFGVATTDHLWNEVLRALSYERVKRLFERSGVASPDARVALLGPLLTRVAEVPPTARWVAADPDDDWVVQCALTAHAERIVTGDRALLAIRAIEKVTILTSRQVLAELGIAVQ
jgi:putative PIN family toxin of toxin-antitoxin system